MQEVILSGSADRRSATLFRAVLTWTGTPSALDHSCKTHGENGTVMFWGLLVLRALLTTRKYLGSLQEEEVYNGGEAAVAV
jgi:hypothetical protein